MEIVGNKFVVPLEIVSIQFKEDCSHFDHVRSFHNVHGTFVPLHEGGTSGATSGCSMISAMVSEASNGISRGVKVLSCVDSTTMVNFIAGSFISTATFAVLY